MSVVLGFFSMGPSEMLIIGIVAVLLFGERLPEVGRSLGKSFIEFKKGISGLENEFRSATSVATHSPTASRAATVDHEEATAPKFEPPQSEPPQSEPSGERIEA
jgi:sec-independent protein translocase protein TatA